MFKTLKHVKVLSKTATEYNGYVKCSILLPNKQGLFIQMHRIVAEAFIHNDMPDKKIIVDHINGDTLDYRLSVIYEVGNSFTKQHRC